MKRLNLYIARQLFVTMILALAILTFVMASGNLMKAQQFIARGMPVSVIVRFLLYILPFVLQFTLPLAMLCATVLVFSRLSADREITAMRASGVSLWQVISPGVLLAILLSAFCFYLQTDLAPECRYRASLLKDVGDVGNPAAFLEPGRHVEFPGHIVYVGDRAGNVLEDVQIYILDRKGSITRDISAQRGRLSIDHEQRILTLALYGVTLGEISREKETDRQVVRHSSAQRMTYTLDYGRELLRRRLLRDPKHMGMQTILSTIYIYNKQGRPTTPLYLELHKRMSLAFSPIGFLLMGIPFGIRTRRSETSAGLVVSLLLVAVFYIFLALADSLEDRPRLHPEVLVWIPNILYQVGGLVALHRIMRR